MPDPILKSPAMIAREQFNRLLVLEHKLDRHGFLMVDERQALQRLRVELAHYFDRAVEGEKKEK